MNEKLPSGIVLKYYLYQITLSTGFSLPIWVIFLQSRGLTLGEVALLDGLFSAVVLFSETPTGIVGDRIGRRNSLLISVVLLTLSMLAFGVARSFPTFVLVYVVWAIGMTFRSGTASAWLYDALKEHTREDEFATVSGRARSFSLLVTAGTALLAGFLADINLFYPFLATAIVNGAGIFVVLSFPESSQYEDDDGDSFTISDAIPVVRDQLLGRSLRSFVVYTVLFFSLLATIALFIQPASTAVGVDVEYLGLMYAGFTGVSAATSYFAGTIEDRIGIRRWIHLVPLLVGGLFLLVGAVSLFAIPMFFVLKAVQTATKPVRDQYVNDHTASVGRATVLSTISMVSALAVIPLKVVGGELADAIGPIPTIVILGGVLLVGSVLVLLWERPVQLGAESPEAASQ